LASGAAPVAAQVARALTEREILKSTNHPFIVPLYYALETDTNLYFVMEVQ
jgi:serine/threonine protein kinase